MKAGVLLVAHGTVDQLDDLPAFLANIRRGHPAPPELVAEVRRRYEAIGGRSPLNAINREVAAALEARLGLAVRVANRLWAPTAASVLTEMTAAGISRVAVVPLAQHSAHVYAAAVRRDAPPGVELRCAANWGCTPALTGAFAGALREALAGRSTGDTEVIFTAHSLPVAVLRGGDPYEREVRASADAIAREVGGGWRRSIAFQSQGFGAGEWLGPDLAEALDAARASGAAHVVVSPIGFLADHVEILYDLDIEAKGWAAERGLTLSRTRSLDATPALIDALVEVATPLLT